MHVPGFGPQLCILSLAFLLTAFTFAVGTADDFNVDGAAAQCGNVCRPTGTDCKTSTDSCSFDDVCNKDLMSNTGRCTVQAPCCSGECSPSTYKCCSKLGQSCSVQQDCCNSTLACNQRCCYLYGNTGCAGSSECCDGTCLLGTCCALPGDYCKTTADCCAGLDFVCALDVYAPQKNVCCVRANGLCSENFGGCCDGLKNCQGARDKLGSRCCILPGDKCSRIVGATCCTENPKDPSSPNHCLKGSGTSEDFCCLPDGANCTAGDGYVGTARCCSDASVDGNVNCQDTKNGDGKACCLATGAACWDSNAKCCSGTCSPDSYTCL